MLRGFGVGVGVGVVAPVVEQASTATATTSAADPIATCPTPRATRFCGAARIAPSSSVLRPTVRPKLRRAISSPAFSPRSHHMLTPPVGLLLGASPHQ